jgi:hypothetical protein
MPNQRRSGLLAEQRAIAYTAIGSVKSGCRIREETRPDAERSATIQLGAGETGLS